MKNLSWSFEAPLSHDKNSLSWNSFILVPEEIAGQIRETCEDRRIVATFNDAMEQHCALMSRGNGEWYVFMSQALYRRLGQPEGGKIRVRIVPDNSKYGMPMPEELEAVLAEDPVADRFFHGLTPGRQRTLIQVILKIKNPDLRIRRSWIMADHLVKNEGSVDFKSLNQEFRNG